MPCACSTDAPKVTRPPPIITAPSLWGPKVWILAHSISFLYNPVTAATADAARTFYEQLSTWLPCQTCADHYAALVTTELPLQSSHLASADALSRWFVDVHNRVNARLGKPQITYARARQLYLGGGTPIRARMAVSHGLARRWSQAFWQTVLIAAFSGRPFETLLVVAPVLLPIPGGVLTVAASTPEAAVKLRNARSGLVPPLDFTSARDVYAGIPITTTQRVVNRLGAARHGRRR